MNTAAAWICLASYVALVTTPSRIVIQRWVDRLGLWSVSLLFVPYLLAVDMQPSLGDLLRLGAYVALPTLLIGMRPREAKPLDLFHFLTIFCIWAPLEPGLFVLGFDLLTPGWSIGHVNLDWNIPPAMDVVLAGRLDLPLDKLTAILLTVWLFTVQRPLEGIGLTFNLTWQDLRRALIGWAGFLAIGIPLGLAIDFIHFSPGGVGLPELAVRLLGGYLLVALPEELLFRGVFQNLLEKRSGRGALALVIAAGVFGIGHLNNFTDGYAPPNWGYVLMASIAGLAYGWVWMTTRKVTASAITHALVNFCWLALFK